MPEYGPYEQPGWPTSLPYFKPAETFRNAFGMASEINRRKQQLENQMMAMSLRAQQSEITNQIRVADFQRKLEQGDQRMALAEKGLELRELLDQHRMQTQDEKMTAAAQVVQDNMGFSQYMLESGKTIKDPDYATALRQAKVLYPNSKVDVDNLITRFNSHRDDLETKSTTDEKHILENAQKELFRGRPVDTGVFMNANRTYRNYLMEPTPEEKKQGVTPDSQPVGAKKRIDNATGALTEATPQKDEHGNPKYDETTRSVYFPPQGTETTGTFIPVATSKLKDYQKRLLSVYDERKKIPNPAGVEANPERAIRVYTTDQLQRAAKIPGQMVIWHNPKTGKDEIWGQ